VDLTIFAAIFFGVSTGDSLGHSQNCSGNCSRNKRESLRSRYSLFPFLVPISICSQLLKKVSFGAQKSAPAAG